MVGINYYLDRLPTGYQLMEHLKAAPKNENDVGVLFAIFNMKYGSLTQ